MYLFLSKSEPGGSTNILKKGKVYKCSDDTFLQTKKKCSNNTCLEVKKKKLFLKNCIFNTLKLQKETLFI